MLCDLTLLFKAMYIYMCIATFCDVIARPNIGKHAVSIVSLRSNNDDIRMQLFIMFIDIT